MHQVAHERRVHKVFITRNTEYHVRDKTCVAVRDRRSGEWLRAHLALRSKLSGSIRFAPAGQLEPNAGIPEVGESLFFHASGRDLVTSTILAINRPAKDTLLAYAV